MEQNPNSTRILYIEDEPFHMEYTIEAIENAGFEVEVVDNIRDVPNKLLEGNFEVILLDIMMDCPSNVFTITETRNGFHTGKKIYEEYITKLAPNKYVIVLTALNLRTNMGKEAYDFFVKENIPVFSKPFSDEELVNQLIKLTGKGSTRELSL